MSINVIIHLERVQGDPDAAFVWWAETADISGLSAAADHLPDLLDRVTAAVRDLAGDTDLAFQFARSLDHTEGGAPEAAEVTPQQASVRQLALVA